MIEARGLKKSYKTKGGKFVHALSGLDLTVPQGTVKALLGPNGAGKTTTVKVLTTLITPNSGTATINNVDILAKPKDIRSIIGVSGQYSAVDENLTGYENLEMVARLYHLDKQAAKKRASELIELFDLVEAQNRPVKGFSGGMRRRIDLAGALIINPKVLFLDEPTTGLDPRSRLALWDVIKELANNGTTVLLTTQYLEEADQLADNISVIDGGKVIAEGTADTLKAQVGGHRIEITLANLADVEKAKEILLKYGHGDSLNVNADGREMQIPASGGTKALQNALADLSAAGIELHDAGMRRPTLDDVFLELTGHSAEDADSESKTAQGRTKK